jgi:hypothetical protein
MILKDKQGNDLCLKCEGNYEYFCKCRLDKLGFGKESCYHKVNQEWGYGYYPVLPEWEKYPFFRLELGYDYEYQGNTIKSLRKERTFPRSRHTSIDRLLNEGWQIDNDHNLYPPKQNEEDEE